MAAYAKLYCKKTKPKLDGTSTIYFVLKVDGKEKLISSGKSINPDLFDNNSGSIKSKASYSKLNAYLTRELNKINDIILAIEYRNQKLTFDILARVVLSVRVFDDLYEIRQV